MTKSEELIPILSRALRIYETGAEMIGPEPVSYTKDEVLYVLSEAVAKSLTTLMALTPAPDTSPRP